MKLYSELLKFSYGLFCQCGERMVIGMKRYILRNQPICITDVDFTVLYQQHDNLYDVENVPPEILSINKLGSESEQNIDVDGITIGNIPFDTIDFSSNPTKIISSFLISVVEDSAVIYYPCSNSEHRLWLNGEFALLCEASTREVYTLKLKRGNNLFCIENTNISPDTWKFIRIESFQSDICEPNSLIFNNYYYNKGEILVIMDHFCLTDGKPLKIEVFPKDLVNIDVSKQIRLFVKDKFGKKVFYETGISFNRKYIIDLSCILDKVDSRYNVLWLCFEITLYDGTKKCNFRPIFQYQTRKSETERLIRRANELLKDKDVPDVIKKTVRYYCKVADMAPTDCYMGDYLREIVDLYDENRIKDYLSEGETRRLYYHSDIDDRLFSYVITFPKHYNPSKKHPALIMLSTYGISFMTAGLKDFSDILLVEICGRGITMGSYIGEAAFWDCFSEIQKTYKLDEKKIFITGHSNAATAAVSLAQAYPHLFAGVYAAAGAINANEIKNLHNMKIRFLTTDMDAPGIRKAIESFGNSKPYLPDYICYRVKKIMHGSVPQVQYTKAVLDELFLAELDMFPRKIYYRTNKNRHLRAYWIEISGISTGKEYADIFAEIVKDDLISIRAHNCDGIKMKVPPQVSKKKLTVIINNKTVFEGAPYGEFVAVNKSKRGFVITNQKTNVKPYYKGNGLLDVYCTPMRIINLNNGERWAKTASILSKPVTNGFIQEVDVSYPIGTGKKLARYAKRNSLIVLDCLKEDSKAIRTIREQSTVKVYPQYYQYRNETYNGNYLIMQIMSNPWNPERSILLINCNDESLLQKCLFTRKMILPAYINGYHPFLNSAVLIYDGTHYDAIREPGMAIQRIEQEGIML